MRAFMGRHAAIWLLLATSLAGYSEEPGGPAALPGAWLRTESLDDYLYSLWLDSDGNWTFLADETVEFECGVVTGAWRADADSLYVVGFPEATRAFQLLPGDSTLVLDPEGNARTFQRIESAIDSSNCFHTTFDDLPW